MTRFKWAVLACATTVALVAVLVPGANSASHPRLRITTVVKSHQPDPTNGAFIEAKCPRGYSVIGGGFSGSVQFPPTFAGRLNGGRVFAVRVSPAGPKAKTAGKRSGLPGAEAICAKGAGGFDVKDDHSGL